MRAEAPHTEIVGTRTPQHLHAAQFGDDDERVGGKEGEGSGDGRLSG